MENLDKQIEQILNTSNLLAERVQFISAYQDGMDNPTPMKTTVYRSYIQSALNVAEDLEKNLGELKTSLHDEL